MTRPIRKRAFYRALKAGILWAIVPYCFKEIPGMKFAKVLPDRNCPNDSAYITWPIKLIPWSIER